MINTVQDLLVRMRKLPENPRALNSQNPTTGVWESLSTTECLELIKHLSAALTAIGVKKGDKVAILAPPSALWTLCDMAIMQMGCVSVPIYYGITEEHVMYEVEHSEAKVIFVSGLHRPMIRKNADRFKHIISLDGTGTQNQELDYREFVRVGKEYLQQHQDLSYPLEGSDLATIVYTSGTTSLPKGVELTQRNMMCQLLPGEQRIRWGGMNERYLNYLPMAHIFGRLVNQGIFASGGSIYYLNDPATLIRACHEVKPTVLVFIPRILEKIYNLIRQNVENEKNPIKRFLARWAFKHAHKANDSWYSGFFNWLADDILYSKVRAMFGNSLSKPITGSAKSNPVHLNFFHQMKISIIEGYGLTEACPAISNIPGKLRFGYLGYPMPGVEAKLSETGEILLRGEVVMKGYHKNPEATEKVIDKEGWLHTGDFGVMEEDGAFKFQNRVAEICKSSYGEFVNLCQLESMIKEHLPFVDSGVVIAENRPFVTMLLFIDCDRVAILKERLALKGLSDEEILRMDLVKKQFESALEKMNGQLSPWERIRDYRFIFKKMTVEDGELSPTMKQKRFYIVNKYKDLVDEMYPEKVIHVDLRR